MIPADVAKAAQSLWDSMLVAAPYDVPAIQGRMARVPSFSATTVAGGKVHKPIAGDSPTLTVSDEGVMLTRAPGEHVTVRYADAAALLRWNDGKRSLIGGDGFTIVLDPAQWKNGAAVVSAVTARVPDDLVLPLDRPGPATPRPQRGRCQPPASAERSRPRARRGGSGWSGSSPAGRSSSPASGSLCSADVIVGGLERLAEQRSRWAWLPPSSLAG